MSMNHQNHARLFYFTHMTHRYLGQHPSMPVLSSYFFCLFLFASPLPKTIDFIPQTIRYSMLKRYSYGRLLKITEIFFVFIWHLRHVCIYSFHWCGRARNTKQLVTRMKAEKSDTNEWVTCDFDACTSIVYTQRGRECVCADGVVVACAVFGFVYTSCS